MKECNNCKDTFDCIKPCSDVIGWADLPPEMRVGHDPSFLRSINKPDKSIKSSTRSRDVKGHEKQPLDFS